MSRGKKLDLFIGAKIDDGWSELKGTTNDSTCKEFLAPSKHQLHFKKEKRAGKVVTLVGRFALHVEDAKELLKWIKKSLGCGGSYKEPYMEFQGELQEKLKALLLTKEFKFK